MKKVVQIIEDVTQVHEQIEEIIVNFKKLNEVNRSEQLNLATRLKQHSTDQIAELGKLISREEGLRKKHGDTYDELETKDMELDNQIEQLKNQFYNTSEILDVPSAKNESAVYDEEANQEIINEIEDEYERMQNQGQKILTMVVDMNKIASNIEDEIYEQRLKILRSRDLIKDSQSSLEQTKKLVSFFSKAMAKDKFIKIMLVIIISLIIATIGLSYAFRKKNFKKELTQKNDELTSIGLSNITVTANGEVKLNDESNIVDEGIFNDLTNKNSKDNSLRTSQKKPNGSKLKVRHLLLSN